MRSEATNGRLFVIVGGDMLLPLRSSLPSFAPDVAPPHLTNSSDDHWRGRMRIRDANSANTVHITVCM